MASPQHIQDRMYRDFRDSALFQKAQAYGFEYLANAFEREVFPTNEALEAMHIFDESMPVEGADAMEVVEQLNTFGAPATVSQVAGRYFGFVNGSAVPAGLAAKLLASFWDQNAAMQVISPIASRLEQVVEGWLKEIFDLPETTAAGYVSGTSMATFCGLAAARYRLLERQGWDVTEKGLFGAPNVRVVTGRQAHSTVIKALNLLGFGKENIEWAEVDDQGRVVPETLPPLDSRTILILQAGNVNSGAFDPLAPLCEAARSAGAWVHVDGAFGLWAGAARALRDLTLGMEKASSWSVDGHKTLNTPYDCGIILCADREALVSALHMSGSYIVLGDQRDGMFFTPEMSRRARIIELWSTIKYLGRTGIDQMITRMHERSVQFRDELLAAGFEILNDVVFNQTIVSCGSDALTESTLKHVQQARVCWAGGSRWQGRSVIRISVSSWATTESDVTRSVKSFIASRDRARAELAK